VAAAKINPARLITAVRLLPARRPPVSKTFADPLLWNFNDRLCESPYPLLTRLSAASHPIVLVSKLTKKEGRHLLDAILARDNQTVSVHNSLNPSFSGRYVELLLRIDRELAAILAVRQIASLTV
jgi:hypothetical protein